MLASRLLVPVIVRPVDGGHELVAGLPAASPRAAGSDSAPLYLGSAARGVFGHG
jgi:hypothetical protein